ncbi:MAG: PQQ-binding-like beta-propeller repeat protein [Thermoplasmata archaeon]|nr:PQQ-binding-like beta-propeller repeat protein [Thermoplasmata archaeon]
MGLLAVSGGALAIRAPTAAATSPTNHALAAQTTPSADWPMYLHDIGRSGSDRAETLLSSSSASSLKLAWSYSTQGVLASQPVIVGGTVYFGSWDGYFYAVNMTGGLVWKSFLGIDANTLCLKPPNSGTPRGITSSATVVRNTVYVAGGDGAVYALNASTGSHLWRTPLGNTSAGMYLWASPLVVGTALYMGIASSCDHPLIRGTLVEINAKTGTLLHRFVLAKGTAKGAGVWGSPTFDSTTHAVYVVTGNSLKPNPFNDSVVEFDDARLAELSTWHIPISQNPNSDSDFGTTPTLVTRTGAPDLIVAPNKNGVLYAWNASNVSTGPLWEQRISNGGVSPEDGHGDIAPAAFDGSTLFVGGELITESSHLYPGSVVAVDPGNGTIVWRENLPGHVLAAVAYADGLVAAGAGPTLELLDASNGTPVWNATPSPGVSFFGAPAISRGCIYEGSPTGVLYAWGVPGSACLPSNLPAPRTGGSAGLVLRMAVAGPAALLIVPPTLPRASAYRPVDSGGRRTAR